MMSIIVAAVAVCGTLLGSVLTHLFQSRHAKHLDTVAVAARLRHERIDQYSAFASAVAEFRGAQLLRWLARQAGGKDTAEYAQLRSNSWRVRTEARGAMYGIHLLADDENLIALADEAVRVTIDILEAPDRNQLSERADASARATTEFVSAAAAQLRS